MISIKAYIDYDIPGLFATERQRREVLHHAWADTGRRWHAEYLPRHFRRGAAERYGYRPRTAAYLRRKERLARGGRVLEGGKVDLVATGLMRRTMEQGAVIRGFLSRFRVEMNVPSYGVIRRQPSRQVGPSRGNAFRAHVDEAQAITESELQQLADYLAARITHHNERVRRRWRATLR